MQLATSAFLASAAATRDLVQEIFPLRLQSLPTPNKVDALSSWSSGHGNLTPSSTADCVQKTSMDQLLQKAPRAWLLAVLSKESGAWLNALSSTSLGLRMDDDTIRVVVGLRLGSVLCHPHTCQHCDREVDQLVLYGLSCKKSEGRHYCHLHRYHLGTIRSCMFRW